MTEAILRQQAEILEILFLLLYIDQTGYECLDSIFICCHFDVCHSNVTDSLTARIFMTGETMKS